MHADIPMVVDCETCPVREVRCADCMVTTMASLPLLVLDDGVLPLDVVERRAVGRFIAAGVVSAAEAATLMARREPWEEGRAVV